MQTTSPNRATERDDLLPSAILETCLHVSDLPRARAFYSGLFGYAVMKSDDRFCAFNVGGRQVLILFRRGSDPLGTRLPFGFIPGHGTEGQAHIGFSVPEDRLTAWRTRLAERGIPEESSFTWPTGAISIYFRDPDGHLLELLTPGVWPNY
ncbi:MAG: VOC family protein [Verrucomicrobiales bacterium]|nr:VOC family protein [Verrucomicrobiales bacterium]